MAHGVRAPASQSGFCAWTGDGHMVLCTGPGAVTSGMLCKCSGVAGCTGAASGDIALTLRAMLCDCGHSVRSAPRRSFHVTTLRPPDAMKGDPVNWVESPANLDGVCGHEIMLSSIPGFTDALLGEYMGKLPCKRTLLVGETAPAEPDFACRRLLRDRRFPEDAWPPD